MSRLFQHSSIISLGMHLKGFQRTFQLLESPAKHLKPLDFKSYYLAVKNVNNLGLDVKQLLEKLDEHLATMDLARKGKDLRDAKKKKREMKSIKKAARLKKAEIEKLKSEVQELEDDIYRR